MKRFLSILLAAASLLVFCSCSNSSQTFSGSEPDARSSDSEQSNLRDNVIDGAVDKVVGNVIEDKNAEQTWSKDFDGAVLTVKTDKAEYKLGEEINLTTSVKNNTDETIGMYVSTSTENSHEEITTKIGHDGRYLFDPDASMVRNCAVNIVKLKPGEEYVQNERRITFFLKDYDLEEFELAPVGEYTGRSSFCLVDDPNNFNRLGDWSSLEFAITLAEPDEPVEMYKFPPREDPGLYTMHRELRIEFEAETEKSFYHPGEPITINIRIGNGPDGGIELVGGFSSVFPHECTVYPWATEEDIIEKQPLPEGVKIERNGEFTDTLTFTSPSEPGEYTFDFSADIRLSSGRIQNYSFIFSPMTVSLDDYPFISRPKTVSKVSA